MWLQTPLQTHAMASSGAPAGMLEEDDDMENVVFMDREAPMMQQDAQGSSGGLRGWWHRVVANRAGFQPIQDLEGGYDDTPMSRPIGMRRGLALVPLCRSVPRLEVLLTTTTPFVGHTHVFDVYGNERVLSVNRLDVSCI